MIKIVEHKKKETHEAPKTAHVSSSVVEDGKTMAILAYITWVGLLIAFIMNNEKKNAFAKYHIRQALLLMLAALVIFWIPVIGWILSIVLLVFWVMGLISAINGQEKEIPFIGKYAQEWFKGL